MENSRLTLDVGAPPYPKELGGATHPLTSLGIVSVMFWDL